ncbi:hypothetical protein SDC9_197441 [bioreactor metagenome]|uniref:Uncharacterized protein n=1 Tax=bioreactor metagenome TaxID=1076179 RepID=A0A645IH66_9ZZZZ
MIVEAHAVDDAANLGQPEHPGAWIARLRPGGDGADLNETEAQAGETVDRFTVLVQTGSQTNAIGKTQSHDLDWRGCKWFAGRKHAAGEVEGGEGEFVGGFRVKRKQQRAGDVVEHRGGL